MHIKPHHDGRTFTMTGALREAQTGNSLTVNKADKPGLEADTIAEAFIRFHSRRDRIQALPGPLPRGIRARVYTGAMPGKLGKRRDPLILADNLSRSPPQDEPGLRPVTV